MRPGCPADFDPAPALAGSTPLLVIGGLVYVVLIGFAVAAICGYMAGLIGSSNSPISGVGILTVMIAALLIKVVFGRADDTVARNVDLPALGSPTNPASAISFRRSQIHRSSPG